MYEKELQNLGLSEKEAKVYTTALELGPDTALNIAKESGINRATTYVQIESLKDRGLMSEFEKGKKTYYAVESPEILSKLIEKQETSLRFQKQELGSVLPQLLKHFDSSGDRPKIRFFEGEEGISQIRSDFLKTKNETIYGFMNFDKVVQMFGKQMDNYSEKRIERKIYSKLLYTSSKGPVDRYTQKNKLREARFIPKTEFPFSADITIYRNKVAFISYNNKPIGVIMESKEITDTMKALFHLLWNARK